MRAYALVVGLLLTACNRDRDSLGTFDEVRRMVLAPCGTPQHRGDMTAKDIAEFRCTLGWLEQSLHAPGCPCDGSMTLHRAKNGRDADVLRIQVDHCPHDAAVHALTLGFEWILTGKLDSSSELAAQYKHEIDEPAYGTTRELSLDDVGSVSALRVYGDRVVELHWSRDAFRQNDGSIELQSTESYLIAIRARRKGDVERVTVREEPHVTGVPVCK